MNSNLKNQLQTTLKGRVALVGVGCIDRGDDGFGVRLAEELDSAGVPHVIVAASSPEQYTGQILGSGAQHVVFLDAVELDAAPGSAVFLSAAEMKPLYPQISTHKISLGTLANLIESLGNAKVWFLGARPESLNGNTLSPTLRTTTEALKSILIDSLGRSPAPAPEGLVS